MNSLRVFRGIAIVNVVCGGLTGIGVVVGSIALVLEPTSAWWLHAALFAIGAVIAGGLVDAAVRHLKRPSLQTALALAANTSVIIWLGVGSALRATNLGRVAGPAAGTLIALVLAFLVYRFYLRPAALRTHRAEANPGEAPATCDAS